MQCACSRSKAFVSRLTRSNPREISEAVRGGAELILSANASNREAIADLGCEAVVIPDKPATLEGRIETANYLASHGVPVRLDPVLEPIGCGFANSLGRFLEIRPRWPDARRNDGYRQPDGTDRL